MDGQPLVFSVVLNYNGSDDTINCIESLQKVTYKNHRIVIVDNDSSDHSEKILTERYPELPFIQTGKNLGYAGGNNAGIRFALGQSARYVCILNNDVEVEPGFLEPVVGRMEQDPSIGIAGPKVCDFYMRDSIQSTGARVNLYTGRAPSLNPGKDKNAFTMDLDVDSISGACLVMRDSLVRKIGLIPELYFMFFEETEWCLHAKRDGFRVVCVCSSTVYHKGPGTSHKLNSLRGYYMFRNQIIFEKRNANLPQLAIFLLFSITKLLVGLVRGPFRRIRLKAFFEGLAWETAHNKICSRY